MICFVLKHDRDVIDAKGSIELLSTKVGTVLLFLGVLHLVLLSTKEERNTEFIDVNPLAS